MQLDSAFDRRCVADGYELICLSFSNWRRDASMVSWGYPERKTDLADKDPRRAAEPCGS